MSISLNFKWVDETLTREDVKEWAKKEPEVKGLTDEELDHVVHCLYDIYLWYHGKAFLGHFLTAIVENDFKAVCGKADSTNAKVLILYAKFLYNIAPMDYVTKLKAKE